MSSLNDCYQALDLTKPGRNGSGTAAHLGREESFSKRDQAGRVERPVTEVQRSFDPSLLERQVTAAADIQACLVTGSETALI